MLLEGGQIDLDDLGDDFGRIDSKLNTSMTRELLGT